MPDLKATGHAPPAIVVSPTDMEALKALVGQIERAGDREHTLAVRGRLLEDAILGRNEGHGQVLSSRRSCLPKRSKITPKVTGVTSVIRP